MTNKMHLKSEQYLRYKLNIRKEGTFYLLNNICENVTLVQLMEKLVNWNHAISIVRSWIFDSNYE